MAQDLVLLNDEPVPVEMRADLAALVKENSPGEYAWMQAAHEMGEIGKLLIETHIRQMMHQYPPVALGLQCVWYELDATCVA